MEYRNLGRSGLKVSRLCLGTMSFGRWIGEEEARRVLDTALDAGITFIDTADFYGRGQDTGDFSQIGEAETILGRLLKGRRDDVVLATKVYFPTGPGPNEGGLSRKHVLQAAEASLRRLQTEYVDLYIIHRWDAETPIEETLLTLNDLVRAGKVRYVGASNLAAWQLCKALGLSERLGLEPFVSVQPELSILRRAAESELLPFCESEGLGVTVYSPLARGLLTGKYGPEILEGRYPAATRAAAGEERLHRLLTRESLRVVEALKPVAEASGRSLAQLALGWVLAKPVVTSAIIGASRAEQLGPLVEVLGHPLSAEEVRKIEEVYAGSTGQADR
ncbi:aldo/keto reductase [Limnochorda pilosa]|uniref:Aldo/keto reductase n=1 Tax=Limnochorda pilosa TaxID=1555112 RepID=A0A0K2SL82_LIMPI|nr:aldo/keto reductase [Limnochorda pilosa]BAS27860.1 aldo/keto reductase [Limnochorda pilosa]